MAKKIRATIKELSADIIKETIKKEINEANSKIVSHVDISCATKQDVALKINDSTADDTAANLEPPTANEGDTAERKAGTQTGLTSTGGSAAFADKKNGEIIVSTEMPGPKSGFKEKPIGKSLSEEEKSERSRLYEQAILMLNYKNLASESQNDKKRYKNFARLISSGGMESLENPAEIFNSVFKKSIKFDLLLNATSAQLSYLTPTVRIYKQFKSKQKDTLLNLEIPLQQQYELEDFETIFKNREGRGGGAGFKGISMKNLGDGLGLIDNYEFDLSFTFADMSEMSKVRYIYQSTPEQISQGFSENYSISYLDLLLPNTKYANVKNAANSADLEHFQIKVVVGWSVSRTNKPDFITEDFIDEIENLKESFYLTKKSHTIDFQQDGVLDVKISYSTYMDASLSSQKEANLLYNPNTDKLSGENEQIRESLIKQRQELLKTINDQNISDAQKQKAENNLQKIENELKNLSVNSLENKYRRFINSIYNKGKIKFITVMKEDYQNFEIILNNISGRQDKMFDNLSELQRYTNYQESLIKNSFSLQQSDSQSASATLEQIPTKFKDEDDRIKNYKQRLDNTSKELEKKLKQFKQPESSKSKFAADKTKIIPFFYLGDLIDSLLEDETFGGGSFYKKNLKVITGPMYFYDFGDLMKQYVSIVPSGVENTKDPKKSIKWYPNAKIINIADIPISLNLYQQWFLEEIVNKAINTFTFNQFMDSIFKKLIIMALENRVYPWAVAQRNKIVRHKVTINKKETRWLKKDTTGDIEEQDTDYTKEHFIGSNNIDNRLVINYNFKDVDDLEYVYYITGMNDAHRFNSDYDEDIKVGIRHIIFNNENGFVKGIKFSRQDDKYNEASILQNANATWTAKLMSGVYDADIDMLGNSFFKMGEKIYIDPTIGSTGLKRAATSGLSPNDPRINITSTVELAKLMGLGGYYVVTQVVSNMGPGNYSTRIKCRYEMSGIKNRVDYRIDIGSELDAMSK